MRKPRRERWARCVACKGHGSVMVPRTDAEIAALVEARAAMPAWRRAIPPKLEVLRVCGPCGGRGEVVLMEDRVCVW